MRRGVGRRLFCGVEETDIEFPLKRLESGFEPVEAGRVVEPEQTVYLLAVPTEPACKFGSGDTAFTQHDGELNLENGEGR